MDIWRSLRTTKQFPFQTRPKISVVIIVNERRRLIFSEYNEDILCKEIIMSWRILILSNHSYDTPHLPWGKREMEALETFVSAAFLG